jgi:hypothetical protein
LHRYTQEQKEFIGNICEGLTVDKILEKFTERFNVEVTKKSIKGIMYRNNFKNHMQGHETRFNKHQEPWNKGKKGIQTGGEEGWFKKGNVPPTHKPVGSEAVADGTIMLKIAEPNVWVKKHRYVWEQTNGPIPGGMVVRFMDGNKMNVKLDNLLLVSHRVCTSVVKRKMEQEDPGLNVTAHKLAELELAIKDIKKRMGGKHDEQSRTSRKINERSGFKIYA